MVADAQLPDRRNMLERRHEFPELFDIRRSSGRFVPQPALYPAMIKRRSAARSALRSRTTAVAKRISYTHI